jgi:16S rRNA C967 or C1407 C5-methylase (RsmB/RsmF family)
MSAFDEYFGRVYGDRWPVLLEAMKARHEKTSRSCFGGFSSYVMDSASILAAEALGVRPGDRVLDLCAAPGGKTLLLLESLEGKGELIANELSSERRRRLREVIDSHVPVGIRSTVKITGFDGNRFGLQKRESYDRVLLDAPCSSERHLLDSDPAMTGWKESRTRQLAMRQYSLICSALLSLRRGGTLVYSTCSISPLENDGIIEKLLRKKGGLVQVDPHTEDLAGLERTRFGFQVFPDRARGAGPIYLSRLIKKQEID